jgi:hypothetical protein
MSSIKFGVSADLTLDDSDQEIILVPSGTDANVDFFMAAVTHLRSTNS